MACWGYDLHRPLGQESGSRRFKAQSERAEGYYTDLGATRMRPCSSRQSHDVLFVSFETLFGIRSVSDTGMPLAFDICESRGWSHLSLIAQSQDWYRDKSVWAYVDRLVDYGFSTISTV